jgi:hypothetical protein
MHYQCSLVIPVAVAPTVADDSQNQFECECKQEVYTFFSLSLSVSKRPMFINAA